MISARTVATPLGTVHAVVPVRVNIKTQSPPGATTIATPTALSTSEVHEPDETVAALAEVETTAIVAEDSNTKQQISGLITRRRFNSIFDTYAV
jgi:hypothetical protein